MSKVYNVFLDTNILLDLLGERVPFYTPAAKIMTLADESNINVYTSVTAISTAYYLLAKYENPKNALIKIRKFKVLCKITHVDDETVEKALNSDFKDFEDALQYFGAIASGCNYIVTRNEKDYKNALIPVMNSEDFLTFYKSNQ